MAERIPFVNQQGTGLDELAGAGREAFNVIVDSSGSVRRRPGLEYWCPVQVDARGLDGIYATVNGQVFALSASDPVRQLYKVGTGGATAVAGIDLVGNQRPVFAETESILAFTAGNQINKYVFADNVTTVLGGSPPLASHVVANSSRLLVNDVAVDKTKVWFSGQALGSSFDGFETWNDAFPTSGFFTAEARPDPILALHETTNELFIFGTTTVQIWGPDTNFVFVPLSTTEHGLGAIYSVLRIEQSFAYLDNRRRFVVSDGRGSEVISGPIQRALDELTTVSDCFGFRVSVGPTDVVCWTFPSDGRTFVFQKGSGWGQWSSWSLDTNNFTALGVLAVTHNPVTNETLAATDDGKVGVFKTGTATDFDVGGVFSNRIQAQVTTGFVNRGTDARKHCRKVRIAMRRGESQTATGPVAFLYFRDRPGAWETPIPVDLGASSDTEVVLEFPSLGVYRRRQWKFEFAGTADMVLTEASEEFQVLGD